MLGPFYALSMLILTASLRGGSIIKPVLQRNEAKDRKLTHGQTVRSHGLNPSRLAPTKKSLNWKDSGRHIIEASTGLTNGESGLWEAHAHANLSMLLCRRDRGPWQKQTSGLGKGLAQGGFPEWPLLEG